MQTRSSLFPCHDHAGCLIWWSTRWKQKLYG